MSRELPRSIWLHRAAGVILVIFVITVYFFTFNGYAVSRDEWFLFDATESLARQGNMQQNFQFDAYPPTSLKNVTPPPADTEPMQPALAVPLFWMAQLLPGVGLAHTVWVFNVLITALTVGTLYAYGMALGYRVRAAAAVALVFAVGTIAWPYSRTFFREPLFTFLALLSAYLVLRFRQRMAAGRRPLLTLAAFLLAFTAALFSKEASLLLLPAILVEAFPSRLAKGHLTRRGGILLAALVLFTVVLAVLILNADKLFGLPNRWDLSNRLQSARSNVSDVWQGISGYMFSPARSLWLFSPVLLLGFLGWKPLIRERRWRELLMPLVMLVTFTVGYAIVRGADQWYGGTGWGARYLVPVTPFVALWLLPVIESLFERDAAWWKRAAAGMVAAASMAIQVLAAWVPTNAYYAELSRRDIIPWKEGVWSLRWSPIRVSLELLGDQKSDLAWKYAVGTAWLLPVLCLALAAITLAWAITWARHMHSDRRVFVLTAGSLVVFTGLAIFGGLYAIRQDPRYYGDFRPARDLLSALEPQLEPDDVIVLNDDTYAEFFMNYYKRSAPTVYTLPPSPGERYSPDQLPVVESSNPEDLIHLSNTIILTDLADHHDRLWLVINSSSYISWSVRPVEHYLARHYFPVSEVKSSDIARAVLFDMTPAPPVTSTAWPSQRVDATFDTSLRLVGYDLPGGTVRRPGKGLPVSLLWETLEPVPQDYTVGLFLMSESGELAAQRDSYPVNGFEQTHTWRVGSLHRDNHGVALPADLAPGTYELWAVLYWWQAPADRLPVTDAEGRDGGDHVVLAQIVVRP